MENFESVKIVNAKIKESITRIAKLNELDLVYLFGSFATGTDNQMSDIDIAVLLSKHHEQNHLGTQKSHLITEFARVFMADRIDLTILNTAPFALCFRVAKEGLLLFCMNDNTRVDFEMNATLNYLDFQPFEELYLLEMKRQIRQKGEIDR